MTLKQSGKGAYDYMLKILILGDSAVGKSATLLKFCEDQFIQSHIATIGKLVILRIFLTHLFEVLTSSIRILHARTRHSGFKSGILRAKRNFGPLFKHIIKGQWELYLFIL